MQAFVHHTPHHTQVIKLHKNAMVGTKLVAVGFILLLSMGLANTPQQIYASKFLNQASKSATSNTGWGGLLVGQRGRPGQRRTGLGTPRQRTKGRVEDEPGWRRTGRRCRRQDVTRAAGGVPARSSGRAVRYGACGLIFFVRSGVRVWLGLSLGKAYPPQLVNGYFRRPRPSRRKLT
jgi:hypothetical protein